MAVALVSASCSNDEVIDQRQAAEISFAPTVAMATRGVTTTANIQEYVIDGFLTTDTKSSLYVDNNTFKCEGNTWTTNAKYFWPYTGTLDFYAFSPISTKDNVVYTQYNDARQAVIKDYEVSTLSNAYPDLLYAVPPDKSHANGSDLVPVPINFKHALSQIVFNVKNTNSALVVDVHDIRIANLASKGSYTLPSAYTELAGGPVGSWTLSKKISGGKTYDAFIKGLDGITPESGTVNLTSATNGAMLLLPQTATAWDPKNDADNEAAGSYILVNCRVWTNIAGEKTLLWPNATNTAGDIIYREVAIPVDINWEQGKRYTYTLVFGDGAGYIPPTDTNPGGQVDLGSGDKVLKLIEYDVKVDEFGNEGDYSINSIN